MDPQFQWISLVSQVAGGDYLKYADVYVEDFEEVLFHLLFLKHKDKYISLLNERAMREN